MPPSNAKFLPPKLYPIKATPHTKAGQGVAGINKFCFDTKLSPKINLMGTLLMV